MKEKNIKQSNIINENEPGIHCYLSPSKAINVIHACKLKDGTNAEFHFIEDGCAECLKLGLSMLSLASRRFRFNYAISHFSKQDIEYLTHIDNVNHAAIGAGLYEGSGFPGMGIGRYIRLPGSRHEAEFAITVIDSYQNKGLGSILFALLALRARENGITRFIGYVSSANVPMLRLMDKFGFKAPKYEKSSIFREVELKACEKKVCEILSATSTLQPE